MSPRNDPPYALEDGVAAAFARDGFVKLSSVLSEDALQAVEPAITPEVEARRSETPMAERTTYQRAFVQVTNLWRLTREIERFVLGRASSWARRAYACTTTRRCSRRRVAGTLPARGSLLLAARVPKV